MIGAALQSEMARYQNEHSRLWTCVLSQIVLTLLITFCPVSAIVSAADSVGVNFRNDVMPVLTKAG